MDEIEAFALLKKKIKDQTGFNAEQYKERPFRRRIAVRMRANKITSYVDYLVLLEKKTGEYDLLLNTLTINVTKFFRNYETYEAVREKIFPKMIKENQRGILRFWSAGCASGEEPYSLAIVLQEFLGERKEKVKFEIYGTDIDEESLQRAISGEYTEFSMTEIPPYLCQKYFSFNGKYKIKEDVKQTVQFLKLDLMEKPTFNELDIIFCRNVLIYLSREAQERILVNFYDSLRPGGYLVLGKVETILGEMRRRFEVFDGKERIFRKPIKENSPAFGGIPLKAGKYQKSSPQSLGESASG
ncbi:MAG: protein-glutamate O-methyltransferase CheR [Candidatus Edwardsbacteria bacterium]